MSSPSIPQTGAGPTSATREAFLLQMYSRLWDNIARHINVSWQSITAVFTAVAALTLSDKQLLNFDVAATLILTVCAWAVCHYYDAGAWYNRNLLIIANIERQFLTQGDTKNIHFYFADHRGPNLLTHFKIQYGLVLAISLIVLGYHFAVRVAPGIGQPWSSFEANRGIPYIAALVAILFVWKVSRASQEKYEFLQKVSPGKDTTAYIADVNQRAAAAAVKPRWPAKPH